MYALFTSGIFCLVFSTCLIVGNWNGESRASVGEGWWHSRDSPCVTGLSCSLTTADHSQCLPPSLSWNLSSPTLFHKNLMVLCGIHSLVVSHRLDLLNYKCDPHDHWPKFSDTWMIVFLSHLFHQPQPIIHSRTLHWWIFGKLWLAHPPPLLPSLLPSPLPPLLSPLLTLPISSSSSPFPLLLFVTSLELSM